MDMVKIIECDADECAYNRDRTCHAMAITVGGGSDHRCDTFFPTSSMGGFPDIIGGVGACKSASCRHNRNLECAAPGIKIGHEGQFVDCLTFSAG